MAEFSIPWGGTIIGDAGPYSDDDWSDIWRKLFTRDRTIQGVLQGYANELDVTYPGALVIRVETGAAIVDGKFYESNAVIFFNVVAPGAGSNYYRIVLQKNWIGVNAQTVRAVLLGPNAVAPPAVTQVDGTIWEISLATIRVTSVPVVTLTSTRYFAYYGGVFPLAARQGLATGLLYWNAWGNVNSIPPDGDVLMQIGVTRVIVGAGDNSGSAIVTFPIPFYSDPYVTGHSSGIGVPGVAVNNPPCPAFVSLVAGVSMTVWASREIGSAGANTVDVSWLAIGPRL